MDKPQLNYNEYLRYTFAGGFGILTYLYLNPPILNTLFDEKGAIKDSLFLVLLSILLGSFLYTLHRAFLYPICLKVNYIFLRLSNIEETNIKWHKYVFTQEYIKKEDFRRWGQRDNPKSFAKNLIDWAAQVHFLYCCVWAILVSWIFTENITRENYLTKNWLYFTTAIFIISLRNHYRLLLYDIDVEKFDNKNSKTVEVKKVKTIELKVETED